MAQISYGSITVSDFTDISNIYFEYCLVAESVTANDLEDSSYFDSLFVLSEDSTFNADKTYYYKVIDSVKNSYVTAISIPNPRAGYRIDNTTYYYYQKNINQSTQQVTYSTVTETSPIYGKEYYIRNTDETTGQYVYSLTYAQVGSPTQYYEKTDDIAQSWSSNYPQWHLGYNIWTRQVKQYAEINELEYSSPFLDTAINKISHEVNTYGINIEALQTRLKRFWVHEPDNTAAEEPTDYPYGSYMAAGIEGIPFKRDNSQTYGYNSLLRHSAIHFRYNDADLTSIGQDGINLYYLPVPTFNLTNDTYPLSDKIYYKQIAELVEGTQNEYVISYSPANDSDLYLQVANPSGNPHNQNWYEKVNDNYQLTADTTVIADKDYFTRVNPHTVGYYDLTFTEKNKKGLELNNEGLVLYQPNQTEVVRLSEDGLSIKNGNLYIGGSVLDVTNNTEGSIALTQRDFNRVLLGESIGDLRFAIGDSFGVSSTGKLYANEAVIRGRIQVVSGSDSNVYTKDEVYSQSQIKENYLSKEDATEQYLASGQQVEEIQIIYVYVNPENTAVLPEIWIEEVNSTEENVWMTHCPPVNINYDIYSAIQIKTTDGQVQTVSSKIDNGSINEILNDNGQIDISKVDITDIDLTNVNTNKLPLTNIANSDAITEAINGVINEKDYIPYGDVTWAALTSAIDIDPNPSSPHIDIAVPKGENEDSYRSYLHLQGDQINFVVDGISGKTLVRPQGLQSEYLYTKTLYMGESGETTIGWIFRSNGHLTLKNLKA